MILSKPKI